MHISYPILVDRVTALFIREGVRVDYAGLAAEAICTASLRGTDSHGLRLLPHYIAALRSGRIEAGAEFEYEQTFPALGRLDACHGLAHAAVAVAMEHAIDLARNAGAGFVAVRNSNHCGAMAWYAMRACARNMIGLAFTNATAKVQVFSAAMPFFGINPICIAAPMADEEPFCYDAAPTVMSNNKVKMYKEAGDHLPPDVAADATGKMTLDPNLARMLIPLGGAQAGYKGFGMSMVVDILCSLLSGMPNGRDVSAMYPMDGGKLEDKRYLGQFVGAIRIDAFEDPGAFKRRLQDTANSVRALPASEHATLPVMIPGDPEKRVAAERMKSGIPVSGEVLRVIG